MTNKKQKLSRKKITLSEFRAWLEGVEELQSGDWSPTADQWVLIRNKVNNIIEEVIEVEVPTQVAPQQIQQHQQQAPFVPPPQASPSFIPPVSTIAIPDDIDITPEARAVMNGNSPAALTPSADGKIKTPNIDSSDGTFKSGFA